MNRFGLVAILLASTGCALVIRRGAIQQPLYVDSDPPGATATLGEQRCETPCVLKTPRSRDVVVTLAREAREPAAVLFRSRLGSATALNLLIPFPGVLVGLAADLGTGAAYELVPPAALVPLAPALRGAGEAPRAPPVPVELAPLRPVRLALDLGLGVGGTAVADGGLLLQWNALATFGLPGPWVVGATVDKGLKLPLLWDAPAEVSTLALVGGAELAPTRNSRMVLLLQAGSHRYDGVSLPALGLRADWTAVFDDGFTLGLYGSWLRDLGTETLSPWDPVKVGGDTLVLGFAAGFLVR